uniref:TSC22 domain family, member 2 n=1 Tax=Monopterus albus TaxID=43700 RepID=A0A3Q3JR56_MONAL
FSVPCHSVIYSYFCTFKCPLHRFNIYLLKYLVVTLALSLHSASGASVVAIDNKIEQAMDLVKSHLMYAVREEVEVLKEQIKELYERNSLLERENAVLKSLANSEQLSQLSSQLNQSNNTSPPLQQQYPFVTNTPALAHHEGNQNRSGRTC